MHKKTQITFIASNVSITSIDGKYFTSSENLLGGVIISVAIVQLYHDENKLHFNEMMMMSALY
jgi:hypothetical protein